MTSLKAINLTQNKVIAETVEVADTAMSRMRGLLGRHSLADGEGLLITRCNSIHMFFMRFPIDGIFLDNADIVVGMVQKIPPFAVSPIFWKADKVLEVASGTIERTGTRLGDRIRLASGLSGTSEAR